MNHDEILNHERVHPPPPSPGLSGLRLAAAQGDRDRGCIVPTAFLKVLRLLSPAVRTYLPTALWREGIITLVILILGTALCASFGVARRQVLSCLCRLAFPPLTQTPSSSSLHRFPQRSRHTTSSRGEPPFSRLPCVASSCRHTPLPPSSASWIEGERPPHPC